MSDASSYDKETGYYRGTPTADTNPALSASHQTTQQTDLIAVPWDDDNFSLCLDTFPSSRLARSKYNQYPTTASPLRKHWGSSYSNASSEEVHLDDDDDEEEEEILRSLDATPLPGLVEIETTSSIRTQKKTSISTTVKTLHRVTSKRDIVAGGIFPYQNNGHFLARIGSEKKPAKIITQQVPIQRNTSNSRNRVEHVSPLSSSSIILQNENDIFNQPPSSPRPALAHKSSNASVRSKLSAHSAMSFSTAGAAINRHQQDHFNCNDSQFSDSQYSDSGESWKVVQRKYSSSAIVVMPSSPPLSHRATVNQQYQPTVSKSHSSLRYAKQPSNFSLNESANVVVSNKHSDENRPSLHYSNSVASSTGFYTPQGSPAPSVISRNGSESVSSYRSLPVPRNIDNLVLYAENTTSSSGFAMSDVKNRDSTYSQVFDPAYNGKRKKSYRKKVSGSVFTKLLKNLKQHFIKTTSNN